MFFFVYKIEFLSHSKIIESANKNRVEDQRVLEKRAE